MVFEKVSTFLAAARAALCCPPIDIHTCIHCFVALLPSQVIIDAVRDILGDYVDIESLDDEKFQIGAWDGKVPKTN